MATMLFVGTAANFLIPLYIQVVQGRSSIETSFSIIPYTLSIFLASTFIAVLYRRFSPRVLGAAGFVVVASALTLLAFTVRGEWGQAFNTLLSSAPKQLAGDVGAWRGLVHNLSGSVGIAVATAFAVGILASSLATAAVENPEIGDELIAEVNFDDADFLTNEQLEEVLGGTSASEAEIAAALEINADARLQALKISLLGLALLSLLAIVPALRMPDYREGDLPEKLEPDDDDAIDEVVDPDRLEATK
jgi:hypothetical protein